MAEHATLDSHAGDMESHRSTYEGFVKGGIALSIIVFFVLVALVSFRFGHVLSNFLGFAGIAAGIIVVAIDARAGNRWYLSLVVLVLYGLLTAINIS
jgi:hypothetical protein